MNGHLNTPSTRGRYGRLRLVGVAAVVIGAAIVAACQPAELSGSGKSGSVIQSGKSMSFEFKTDIDCSTSSSSSSSIPGSSTTDPGMDCMSDGFVAPLKGFFKDEGKNPAFPWGVSMKFEGNIDGQRIGLAIGAGQSDCFTAPGSVNAADDEDEGDEGPACYYGVVTYRSADTKHYPNQTPFMMNPDCIAALSNLPLSVKSELSATHNSSGSETLSGLALVILGDSGDDNRSVPDMMLLATLCGPYANLTTLGPAKARGYGYGYGTCPVGTDGSPFGGMIPYFGIDSLAVYPGVSEACGRMVRGNLEVDLLEGWSTTTTTTTIPPTSSPSTVP